MSFTMTISSGLCSPCSPCPLARGGPSEYSVPFNRAGHFPVGVVSLHPVGLREELLGREVQRIRNFTSTEELLAPLRG